MDQKDDDGRNRDSQQSRKLRQDLMAQLRDTRLRIDPELLAHARRIIEQTAGVQPAVQLQPAERILVPAASRQARGGRRAMPSSALPLDRQKNMATILKFLKLTSHNKRLGQRVQALFPDQQGS